MKKYYVGIDNGVSGAIAVLPPDGVPRVEKLVTVKAGKTTKIDRRWLYDWFKKLKAEAAGQCATVMVVVEQAQMFAKGVKSIASTWYSWGLIETVLDFSGVAFQPVNPQEWQKPMFKSIPRKEGDDTGEIAILVCQRLYPSLTLLPTAKCKKPDDGMADAVLMATFGQRTNL